MAIIASWQLLAALGMLPAPGTREAAAPADCAAMRKITIGVSVAPPNVVHTSPYVALELGYFSNEGFDPRRTQWTIDNDVANGYIDRLKKPTVDQVMDMPIANAAVAAAGGRVIIGGCTE